MTDIHGLYVGQLSADEMATFENKKTGWAIKVLFGVEELYVTRNLKPMLYQTKEEAEEAAKIWKNYKVVFFEEYV